MIIKSQNCTQHRATTHEMKNTGTCLSVEQKSRVLTMRLSVMGRMAGRCPTCHLSQSFPTKAEYWIYRGSSEMMAESHMQRF